MNNLQQCRQFYRDYFAPVIHQRFPEDESRIAVGVVGEGSDCFGFDDEISKDHDYGIGLCIWLTDEDYEKLAEALQQAYEQVLTQYHQDRQRDAAATDRQQIQSVPLFIDNRRGVFRIGEFYHRLLGVELPQELCLQQSGEKGPDSTYLLPDSFWNDISEDKLAVAVNGEVYRDDMGAFTGIRNVLLSYYPDAVWKRRLAVELYHFSQNAQSNYARMMARKDYVTANLCVMQAVKSTMAIVYLLNRKYAPYYKWMRRGMQQLEILSELGQILDAMARVGCQAEAWEGVVYSPYEINMSDPFVKAFEIMAGMILSEMNRQGIVEGENPFLDIYSKQLMSMTDNMNV